MDSASSLGRGWYILLGFAAGLAVAGAAVLFVRGKAPESETQGSRDRAGNKAVAPVRDTDSEPRGETTVAAATADKPNVVWIVLDACRAQNLSCMGYERETSPTVDRLAARGVVFENHFTQGIYTEISVPSYMTGRYFPLAALDVQRIYPERTPPPGEQWIPEIMRRNGYRVACVTAHGMMTPTSRFARAFEEFHFVAPKPDSRQPYAPLEQLNETIFPWIEEHSGERFFLYVHALDTHFPHALSAPHDQWMPEPRTSPEIPGAQPARAFGSTFDAHDREILRGLYDGAIHQADTQIELLLSKLGAMDLLDKTLVLITADHGDALGEDGTSWGHWNSFDEVMRVPLVVAGPGVPAGMRVSALTENVDIVPTLIELLTLDSTAAPDGKSLAPLMRDAGSQWTRDYVVSRYFHHEYDGAQRFVMRGRDYKLEWDLGAERMQLFELPDTVARRTDVIVEKSAAAEMMRERFVTEVWPRWDAYASLKPNCVDVPLTGEIVLNEGKNHGLVEFGGELLSEVTQTDGKWLFRDGELWNSGWAERVPPLRLSMPVPNGMYSVQMQAFSATDLGGHPASSHLIIAQDDVYPQKVQWNPPDKGAIGFEFRPLRVYSIDDGRFDVVLYDDNPAYWGGVRAFRFIPVGDAAGDGEAASQAELLRGLGYIE